MKRKLSNYIGIAFFINIFAIISVGGICIMMVKDMVRNNISHLEEESRNVARIYKLNDRVQQAIFSVHGSIIDNNGSPLSNTIKSIGKIKEDLKTYVETEQEKYDPYFEEENILLDKIKDNLVGIRQVLDEILLNLSTTKLLDEINFTKLDGYGYTIHHLAQTINDLHFKTVSNLVKESYSKMYFILLLYLVSSVVGILASCVGYIVLTRHTIKPIINLASATEKISSGDFNIRVKTVSETEIGTLYQSFNDMTARLQEHEKKREDFNRTLERLVKERTRELRESEESLRRTQSELVRMEKIATLGQIATSVNHEIKTPLNVLYMNLQLLIRKINQCDMGKSELKQGMLDLTEIINGEIIRINEIIEESVKALVPYTAHTHWTDGGLLRLESKRDGACAKILIEDTGQGIADEDLQHIFDPFFTKKDGGMGLGLAIAQRIIENHRGSISCQSEVGKGTSFEIDLPVSPDSICQEII